MLFLVGGPSQLDTWDMKPNAPAEIRGPYKPIKTNVPGVEISEIFPRMARHADKYAPHSRRLSTSAAGVHDTGHQLSCRPAASFQGGVEYPHIGCVLSKLKGPNGDVPPHVLLPRPIGNTGGNMPHGQNAGFLGKTYDPFVLNADPSDPNFKVPDLLPPDYLSALRVDRRKNWREMVDTSVSKFETSQDCAPVRRHVPSGLHADVFAEGARSVRTRARTRNRPPEIWAANRFGQSCLLARRLIEAGVRFVTVNMFETVFDEITWDIHGSKPFQPHQLLSGPGRSHVRHGLFFAAQRPEGSRPARQNHGARHRRIRPHAESESRRRSRPLAAMLDHLDVGMWDQGRPGDRRVGRHRRRAQRTGPPALPKSLPPSITASASRSTRSCRARQGGRFRWWSAASSPIRELF